MPSERWSRQPASRQAPALARDSNAMGDLIPEVGKLRVLSGHPAVLREAFAERVAELRREDPLAPITVLVGDVAAAAVSCSGGWRRGWAAHANVRILMPGDLALLLGSQALVASGAQGAAAARRPGAAGGRRAQAPGVLRAGRGDPRVRRGAVPARAGAARRGL